MKLCGGGEQMNQKIDDLYKQDLNNMKELDLLENERYTTPSYENLRLRMIDFRKDMQKTINQSLENEFKDVFE